MTDIPASTATPVVIRPGESFADSIETRGDRDWIALDVTAGQILRIDLAGDASAVRPLADPLLTVRDADGRRLESNDDAGGGLDSSLIFIAQESGRIYLEAAAYAGRGDYVLSVTETTLPASVLPAIDWGTAVADSEVVVHFVPAGTRLSGVVADRDITAHELARFEAAFDLIAAVCGVTFRVTDTRAEADFRIALDVDELSREDTLGFFNPPGERQAGNGAFNVRAWDRQPGGDLETGGYGFVTIVHELLHGLGLAHPHDNGGGSEVFPGVSRPFRDTGYHDLNQGLYTTMSYNSGFISGSRSERGDAEGLFGYEAGPMALDIAVLQQKYGANMAHATGDDIYVMPGRNGPGTFWSAIWDAGGDDMIQARGARDATIDLRAATLAYEQGGGGFVSSAAGVAGGFTIAAGVTIEAATGARGDDSITGNATANRLLGREGDDSLTGGAGDDVLTGGKGDDVLAGGAGGDNLTGGSGRDTFVFAPGDSDPADGDWIADFGGADRIDLRAFGPLVFIGTDAFGPRSEAGGQLRYAIEGNEAVVAVDADRDGTADLAFRLGGVAALDAGDFLLV